MLTFERKLKSRGYDLIIGVDEAGRGPLAGPVVAAAVCLKSLKFENRIDDSKKLSPAKRKSAFFEIKNKSLYAIASVNHNEIDRINILQATKQAMQKAVAKLLKKAPAARQRRAFVIIDGNMRFKLGLPYQSIVKGDSKSLSIAAASILAKVSRDTLMEKYHKIYPQYGFNKHKGYPTEAHRLLLRKIGPVAIHRKSF
ncbi:MAG: ribonuclease HII, partial [Candidatus Omnitrophota bacterium]|nr:ribonuclease HII [Candidatus Omnitrophota bacterium]